MMYYAMSYYWEVAVSMENIILILFLLFQDLSCVDPNYMSNQSDINERMRGILIDWLIEVITNNWFKRFEDNRKQE